MNRLAIAAAAAALIAAPVSAQQTLGPAPDQPCEALFARTPQERSRITRDFADAWTNILVTANDERPPAKVRQCLLDGFSLVNEVTRERCLDERVTGDAYADQQARVIQYCSKVSR